MAAPQPQEVPGEAPANSAQAQALSQAGTPGQPAVQAPSAEILKTRDPFKRPVIQNIIALPRTDLEMFPIDQFRMLGVVTGPEHLRALLLAPNGKTYFVAERMRIGVRKGVIRRITPESIKVRERIINVLGQEEDVDSELRLPSENRGDGKTNLTEGS